MDFAQLAALFGRGSVAVQAFVNAMDDLVAQQPSAAPAWSAYRALLLEITNGEQIGDASLAALVEFAASALRGRGPVGPTHAHHG